jgi:spermidine/putrescine transport system permease protein
MPGSSVANCRRGDFPLASALALILMAVVTIAYVACARWLKIERT